MNKDEQRQEGITERGLLRGVRPHAGHVARASPAPHTLDLIFQMRKLQSVLINAPLKGPQPTSDRADSKPGSIPVSASWSVCVVRSSAGGGQHANTADHWGLLCSPRQEEGRVLRCRHQRAYREVVQRSG